MKMDYNEPKGELTISEFYLGLGLKTDSGEFAIAERDGGIEINVKGKHVCSIVGEKVFIPRHED